MPHSAKHHVIIGTQMQPECYSQEKKILISDNLVRHATATAAKSLQFSSVQFSHSVVSDSLRPP